MAPSSYNRSKKKKSPALAWLSITASKLTSNYTDPKQLLFWRFSFFLPPIPRNGESWTGNISFPKRCEISHREKRSGGAHDFIQYQLADIHPLRMLRKSYLRVQVCSRVLKEDALPCIIPHSSLHNFSRSLRRSHPLRLPPLFRRSKRSQATASWRRTIWRSWRWKSSSFRLRSFFC
jgi:hypothetical protein